MNTDHGHLIRRQIAALEWLLPYYRGDLAAQANKDVNAFVARSEAELTDLRRALSRDAGEAG